MAVLPASKAYFRGGPPRREYVKGAPLFATTLVKFNGVSYARGDALPVEQMTPHKHWELWLCKKADHAPPTGHRKATPAPADASTLPTSDAPTSPSPDELTDAELERLTAPSEPAPRKTRAQRKQ